MILAILTTLHVLICLFLILVVLLQQGKGADLSVFGGGSTQAVFGARGAATILHKLTVAGFIGFIVTTIGIGLIGPGSSGRSVMAGAEDSAPAAEADDPTAAAVDAADADAADADAPAADPEGDPVVDEVEPPAEGDGGGSQ